MALVSITTRIISTNIKINIYFNVKHSVGKCRMVSSIEYKLLYH